MTGHVPDLEPVVPLDGPHDRPSASWPVEVAATRPIAGTSAPQLARTVACPARGHGEAGGQAGEGRTFSATIPKNSRQEYRLSVVEIRGRRMIEARLYQVHPGRAVPTSNGLVFRSDLGAAFVDAIGGALRFLDEEDGR